MNTWGVIAVLLLLHGCSAKAGELDWLVGCWESADGGSKEVWVRDSDESFIGFGVVVTDGELSFYEVLSLRREGPNTWIYTAHVSGQPPTAFSGNASAEAELTVTNAAHDYPQVISYKRSGLSLVAIISMIDGERSRSFVKESCD